MFAIRYGSSTVLEVLFRAKPNVNVANYVEVHVHTFMYIVEGYRCIITHISSGKDGINFCMSEREKFKCTFSPQTWS